MKLKIEHLRYLPIWLNTPLHGEESRARNQFLNHIDIEIEKIREKHLEMLKKYSQKNEAGEPIINNGSYKIDEEKHTEFDKEYLEWSKQEIEIEPFKNIKTIKKIISELYRKMDTAEGAVYDEVLAILEKNENHSNN